MPRNFVRIKAPAAALSILFLMSVCTGLVAQQQNSSEPDSLAIRTHRTIFVINSPSSASQGADSILTFDSLGNSFVFFSAEHNLDGLRDIACSFTDPSRIVVSHNDFDGSIAELLEFSASGRIVRRIPFGTPGEGVALAFDNAGNFYAAEGAGVFKNGVLFASLPDASEVGKLVVDRRGSLYLTKPVTSQLLRIDSLGKVTLFADATQGLSGPFGLAVDRMDNIYVAIGPPSAPGSILKFDPSGTPSPVAVNISFQPGILAMIFEFDRNRRVDAKEDGDGKLYATLSADDEILKFDTTGNSSIFADADDGLDFPAAIAKCGRSDVK